MNVQLPATYDDLTLAQAMVLHNSEDRVEWISVCSGLDRKHVRELPVAQYDKACEYLHKLREAPGAKHHAIIKLNGVEYGFIPDWTKFSTGEWIDMERYAESWWEHADKIMALLYRPIVRRIGDSYTIESYSAMEDPVRMSLMSATYANGALLFFWTIRNKRLTGSRRSLEAAVKEGLSSRSGAGTTRSIISRIKNGTRWTQSLASLWTSRSSTSHISEI